MWLGKRFAFALIFLVQLQQQVREIKIIQSYLEEFGLRLKIVQLLRSPCHFTDYVITTFQPTHAPEPEAESEPQEVLEFLRGITGDLLQRFV